MIKERPAALKKSEVMCDLMERWMGGGLVPGSWWGVEDDGRTSRQMAHSSTGRIASSLRGKGKKGGGATRGWKLK